MSFNNSVAQVKGDFFAGRRSERQSASLEISPTGQVTVVADDKNTAKFSAGSFSDLEISPRLGNTPRYISFVDGSSFETSHNDKVDDLLVNFRQASGNRFIHWLESHSLIVLLVVVIVSGFIWGSVKYGVPAVAAATAKILPVEVSRYLGQGTLEILDKAVFTPSELTQQRQNELSRLFESYTSEYSELDITVKFRQGKDIGANAMALPDGKIIFTDELVNLARDDLELVAIFGHEVGHLVHRHMLRRVIQDSLLTVLVVLVTGDISSASSIVYLLPGILLELAYSREFESEADDFAYEFLIQNEVETQHFADIMLALMNSQNNTDETKEVQIDSIGKPETSDDFAGKINPYLSTHPATMARIQKFISD